MEERRIPLADFIALSAVVFVKHPDLLYKLVRNFFLMGFLRLKMRTLKVRMKIKELQQAKLEKELSELRPDTK